MKPRSKRKSCKWRLWSWWNKNLGGKIVFQVIPCFTEHWLVAKRLHCKGKRCCRYSLVRFQSHYHNFNVLSGCIFFSFTACHTRDLKPLWIIFLAYVIFMHVLFRSVATRKVERMGTIGAQICKLIWIQKGFGPIVDHQLHFCWSAQL